MRQRSRTGRTAAPFSSVVPISASEAFGRLRRPVELNLGNVATVSRVSFTEIIGARMLIRQWYTSKLFSIYPTTHPMVWPMKAKRGSANEPEIQEPESGPSAKWAGVSEEDLLKAERQIAARMASGIAIWAASFEVYQAMVRDWTTSRQTALRKSMMDLSQIQSSQSSEGRAEQVADVLVEQWSSFQRDFLALQVKTVAKAGALLGKAVEIGRSTERETADSFVNSWKKAEEGTLRADATSEK